MKNNIEYFYDDNFDSTFHYNESMVKDGFVISEKIINLDEGDKTIIRLYFNNKIDNIDLDVISYVLYEGNSLSPIEVYGICKNVYDFYSNNNVTTFIDFVEKYMLVKKSSSMQKDMRLSEKIVSEIKDIFNLVDNHIKGYL